MDKPPPRLLVTRRLPDAVEQALAARYAVTLNPEDTALGHDDLVRAMRDYDALCVTITDRVDADVLGAEERRASLVANFGAGFDNIDLAAAKATSVAVSNTPGVLTEATAEIAITLMLMVARRAGEGEREARAGRWAGWHPTHLLGRGLRGKTLGLVGFGRIAQATAESARNGLGMHIAYFSRSPDRSGVAARLGARHEATLDGLLASSDVVSLHVPASPQTHHMIDAAALSKMKPHCVLINTARGSVVDTDALVHALATGRIAGAGLDVFEGEPIVPPGLLGLENVVILPHLGSATLETRVEMGMRMLANVDAHFSGQPMPDRVA